MRTKALTITFERVIELLLEAYPQLPKDLSLLSVHQPAWNQNVISFTCKSDSFRLVRDFCLMEELILGKEGFTTWKGDNE